MFFVRFLIFSSHGSIAGHFEETRILPAVVVLSDEPLYPSGLTQAYFVGTVRERFSTIPEVPSGFVHTADRSVASIAAVCPVDPSGFTQWMEPATVVASWLDLVYGGLVRTINNNVMPIAAMLACFMICLLCSN
jgi:hypothetical protein